MKKSISKIGQVLTRAQQKQINGGIDCSIRSGCESCGGFYNEQGPTCFGGPFVWGCCS